MKIKNIWIVSGGLIAITISAMAFGQIQIAAVAVGALAGWIGGNRNSTSD